MLYFQFEGFRKELNLSFELERPLIDNFYPKNAGIDDTITITGKQFNPSKDYCSVFVGEHKAEILEASMNEIKFVLNKSMIVDELISQFDTLGLKLKIADFEIEPNEKIEIEYNSRWTKLADFPGGPRIWPVAFSYNGKGYIGLGSFDNPGHYLYNKHYSDFWEYDPNTNKWYKFTEIPGVARGRVASFIIETNCMSAVE